MLYIGAVEVFCMKLHIVEEPKRTKLAKRDTELGIRRYSRITADCTSRHAMRWRGCQVGNWAMRPCRRFGFVQGSEYVEDGGRRWTSGERRMLRYVRFERPSETKAQVDPGTSD